MLPGKKYTPADFVLAARRRAWILIVPVIVGVYAALIVSSQRHEQYQSEMLIQVVPQRVPEAYVRATVTMRTEDRLNALQQELLSRTTLEGIIHESNLYSDELGRMPIEDVVDLMRRSIKIDPVIKAIGGMRDADSFYVRFKYPDPVMATQVTLRLGGLFIAMNKQDRGDTSKEVNEFLQSQLGATRQKLEQQEFKLEQFKQQNAGRLPTQVEFNMHASQAMLEEIKTVTESLARDRDRKADLERRQKDGEAARSAGRSVAAQAAGQLPDKTQTAAQDLAAERANLAQLRLHQKPEHPSVQRSLRRIQELEKVVEAQASLATTGPAAATPVAETPDQTVNGERLAEERAEIDSLTRQIARKDALEQQDRAKLAEYNRHLEQVPGVESEFIALTRDYETQQKEYTDLLSKSNQSNIAVELERRQIGEQFKVLDQARVPIRPTGLARAAVNAAGAAAGLALGLALAIFLELRDTTFSTGNEIFEVLRLPVVAMIPYVISDADRRRARRQRILASSVAAALSVAGAYGVWALELWKHVV